MKRIAAMAIAPFVLALLVNIILGLVRNSFRWGMIFFRATVSTVVVVGLVFIVIMIIKRFLPELLEPVVEEYQEDDGFSSHKNSDSTDDFAFNPVGNKIDVVLNDNPSAGGYSSGFVAQEEMQGGASAQADRGTLSERLRGEDPELLAKAIRTTLSRDDS